MSLLGAERDRDESDHFHRLFDRARHGSLDAQGTLLEACRGFLLQIAEANLDSDIRPKVAASDVVQESLLEAHCDFGRFHGQTRQELRAWLKRILLNNLLNHFRQWRGTQKRQLERELPFGQNDLEMHGRTDRASATASDVAMRSEVREQLDDALHTLCEDYQQVLQLRHFEGLGFEEIGRRMDRTYDAARMLWYRAFDHLSRALKTLSTGDRV